SSSRASWGNPEHVRDHGPRAKGTAMSFSTNAATALVEPEAPVAEGEAAKKIEGRSPWRLGYERLRRDRAAVISVAVILLIILLAIFAPGIAVIYGHGPNPH